jgi:hypothetical protein
MIINNSSAVKVNGLEILIDKLGKYLLVMLFGCNPSKKHGHMEGRWDFLACLSKEYIRCFQSLMKSFRWFLAFLLVSRKILVIGIILKKMTGLGLGTQDVSKEEDFH